MTAVAVAILMLGVPGAAISAEPDTPPTATSFEWERSTPERQGIDSEILLRSIRRIRDEDLDIRSLILIRNDHVILELYVHPYTRDTVHNVKSVSKSILSAVVGIALREGILKSTDQPVREFFPDYFPEDAEDDKNRITLRHLLTMTSGLDLDENGPKMQAVFASADWIRATFEADMVAAPGERFVYSTPLTHTMVGVLTEASGKSVLELADEHLFGPLEFGALQWTRGPQGYYFGGSELFLRTRDMAKFGLLYLHDGQWQGRQIVPAEWVSESTRSRLPAGSANCYGYWWWIDPDDGGFKARGWGGQGITVRHDLRFVAAGTAGDPTASDRMFRDFDLATIRDEPLPPNPEAVATLEALVRELENPKPSAVPALPEIASEISGKTYLLEENPRDFREFTFRFDAESSIATVAVKRGEETLESEIGMDGLFRLKEMGSEGPMPDHNRIALRGRWTPADELVIDSHRVGDPIHATWTMRFKGPRLDAEVEIHPIGQRFTLSGRTSS
jgi:CubicO group peptidase (beta-lactamase class C family)